MTKDNTFKADIKTSGLSQFDSSMAHLEAELPVVSRTAGLNAATMTIKSARPTVPTVSGKTASSLRAYVAGQSGIAEGGSTVDHYRWLELGGQSGRRLAVKRSIVQDGRYIKPGYERIQSAVQTMMNEVLIAKIKEVGLS